MLDRFRGCLLGGALGDALGAGIEFQSLDAIRRIHGDRVRLDAVSAPKFTDDTQMTLFTAEGLIRASVRVRAKGLDGGLAAVVHHAYLRWLHTQGDPWARCGGSSTGGTPEPDGWLVTNRVLHRRAAPGNTCLSALRSGRMGTKTEKLNSSKGCGGVMRAAPAGLMVDDPALAFEIGSAVAAITHSHPSGYLTAGALAAMVACLVASPSMDGAVATARRLLEGSPEAGETISALDAAVAVGSQGEPSAEDIERLGGGWVGEEALAIGVACALRAGDARDALSASVSHSGDSDSTGAICGNLLGAQRGVDAFPAEWIAAIDGNDVVDAVARDLWRERFERPPVNGPEGASWAARYPGW